jgi:broad specificity phosphatase PhoE
MNTFYLLRHGEVKVDPNRPASEWSLSEKGKNAVFELVREGVFRKMDAVYSSEEDKSYSTAKIIADSLEKEVWKLPNFNELDRSKSGFLEDYDNAVKEAFSNFQESRNSWEPCKNALRRFREGMQALNQKHEHKRVLIVSHGIVLTLYFAYLKGEMEHLFSRWRRLDFLSCGIVKDSTVTRDIIE